MKRISILIISLFAYESAFACDICGSYMGVTPYNNASSISFYNRYRSFNGYNINNQKHVLFPSPIFNTNAKIMHGGELPGINPQNLDSLYPKTDYDVYRTYELRLKYFLQKRIEINAIVPFSINSSKEQNIKETLKGMGDASIFLGYHLISKQDAPVWKNRLIIGTGIKIGTGKYLLADAYNIRYDALLQPGTGTNDWLSYGNYLVGYKNLALNTTFMYKVNSTNTYKEKIANSLTNHSTLFYIVKINNVQLMPSAQFYYEHTDGLFRNKEYILNTRMTEAMLGPGLDILYKGFMLSGALQMSIYSASGQTNPGGAGRLILGISYTIMQKKFLF